MLKCYIKFIIACLKTLKYPSKCHRASEENGHRILIGTRALTSARLSSKTNDWFTTYYLIFIVVKMARATPV